MNFTDNRISHYIGHRDKLIFTVIVNQHKYVAKVSQKGTDITLGKSIRTCQEVHCYWITLNGLLISFTNV